MDRKLPSAHQFGDAVNLFFGDAGTIQNAKISKISFDPGKVFYDVEIEVKPNMKTRLRMIDSAFVEKIKYHYAFVGLSPELFFVGSEYDIFTNSKNDAFSSKNLNNKLMYLGYNTYFKACLFVTYENLEVSPYYFIRMNFDEVKCDQLQKMQWTDGSVKYFTAGLIPNNNGKIIQPDEENTSPQPPDKVVEIDEYELERMPQFSIKDLDKVFDDERRNHGTNPIDSINRMYRKLLALKEKRGS